MSIKENLELINSKIEKACIKAGRSKDSVLLCAVSKFHPAQSVIEAMEAGQILFGENRVQEACQKFEEVRGTNPQAELHIIGQLQRNKVKHAVAVAQCIQSVDRIELLDEIEKQCAKIDKKIEVLFELHTGEESKSGFDSVDGMHEALKKCADGDYPHIIPRGFMTMAPNTDDELVVRKSFSTLRENSVYLQKEFPQFDLSQLSMGMSGDFEIAIEEGSTMVRVGTAIFGQRQY